MVKCHCRKTEWQTGQKTEKGRRIYSLSLDLSRNNKRSNPEDEGFKKFVEEKGYEPYLTSKYPDKKLAILTCMDTRLIELLPAALGIRNGDAKVIKNAGGVITHPYGSVMRSLLVAIVELGVEEVMVIGHTDCGVQGMNGTELLEDVQVENKAALRMPAWGVKIIEEE